MFGDCAGKAFAGKDRRPQARDDRAKPADVGIIGTGGKGQVDSEGMSSENIVALCDVDSGTLAKAAKKWPNARLYRDYQIMLDKEPKLDAVTVTITPTYSGCPALDAIRDDLRAALTDAGYTRVEVRTVLSPPWSTDWITEEGHRKLAAVGIAPPSPAPARGGPVPLTLGRRPDSAACPRCGSPDPRLTAQLSATACKSLHRCNACGEPFEAVKPI